MKSAVVRSNTSYVETCTEDNYTKHTSDKIIGNPKECAMSTSVDLCVSLRAKLLKLARYNGDIKIVSQPEKPLRISDKLRRAKFNVSE